MSLALSPLTVTLMGLMMTCDTLKLALGGHFGTWVVPTGCVPILKQVSKRQKRFNVYNATYSIHIHKSPIYNQHDISLFADFVHFCSESKWPISPPIPNSTAQTSQTFLRYALKKEIRYHLGIFPNMGGGVFPNPKTFVNLPSIFLYAEFILRC